MRPFALALPRTALVLALLPAPLAAQAERPSIDDIDVPTLTEAIHAYTALTRWRTRTYPDPLALIRRHATFPLVPPGMTYEPQCSAGARRAVYSFGRAKYDRALTAVTTARLGREAEPGGALQRGNGAAERLLSGDTTALKDLMGGVMAAGMILGTVYESRFPDDPLTKRFRAAGRWYQANGYHDEDRSPDPTKKRRANDTLRVLAILHEVPTLDSPLCVHLGEGPAIVIDLESSAAGYLGDEEVLHEALRPDTLAAAERAFRATLEALPLAEARFDDQLKMALLARHAAALPALPTESHPLLPPPELLARFAAWYREHAATLEPALAALWAAFARSPGG